MRYIFFFLLVIMGCTDSPDNKNAHTNQAGVHTGSGYSDSVQVVAIVKDFFKAFDEKDLKKIDALLIPSTQIIHHNGTVTDTAEMIRIIEDTKDWWPRTRKLSDFEFVSGSNLYIAGFMNEVIFSLPDNKKVIEPYNETWIFEKIVESWKPVRIHYSKVTVEKHSEDVK